MKFTVKESQWLRGGRRPDGTRGPSLLRNDKGERCCMGFLAEACGLEVPDILGAAYFSSQRVWVKRDLLPDPLRPFVYEGSVQRVHPKVASEIYMVNDSPNILDDERKKRLTALFAKAGIEVDFVP